MNDNLIRLRVLVIILLRFINDYYFLEIHVVEKVNLTLVVMWCVFIAFDT